MAEFQALFEPRRVALIGVSPDPRTIGFVVLKNILHGGLYAALADGFLGEVYTVGGGPVLGTMPVEDIAALPDQVDLAILCGPADDAAGQIASLGEKNIPLAVVLAEGDDEACAAIKEAAGSAGVRVIGPGTHGLIANTRQLNASLCPMRPVTGRIALLASNGAVMNSFLQHSHDENVGFSFYLSAGQAADVDDAALLTALAEQPMVNCVAWSFDGAPAGEEVLAAARAVLAKKPLVYLRSGRDGGAELDAALQEAGAFATTTLAEFVDAARALSAMPPARGNRIHVVTNGGPAALAVDTARDMGLDLYHVNDLGAMANRDDFKSALAAAASDAQASGVLIILSLQPGSPPLPISEAIADWAESCEKPITASCVGLAGQPCEDHLDVRGVPEYEFPYRALYGMKALVHWGSRTQPAGEGDEG